MKANREQQNTECQQKDVFLAAVHEAGHALAYTKLGVGSATTFLALDQRFRHQLAAKRREQHLHRRLLP